MFVFRWSAHDNSFHLVSSMVTSYHGNGFRFPGPLGESHAVPFLALIILVVKNKLFLYLSSRCCWFVMQYSPCNVTVMEMFLLFKANAIWKQCKTITLCLKRSQWQGQGTWIHIWYFTKICLAWKYIWHVLLHWRHVSATTCHIKSTIARLWQLVQASKTLNLHITAHLLEEFIVFRCISITKINSCVKPFSVMPS